MDQRDYLDAIQASPDDDLLRVVYADWLKERGDPRGDFIYDHMEAAGAQDKKARLAIMVRAFDRIPELRALRAIVDWDRGFIRTVDIRGAARSAEDLDAIFREAPALQELKVDATNASAALRHRVSWNVEMLSVETGDLDAVRALSAGRFSRLKTLSWRWKRRGRWGERVVPNDLPLPGLLVAELASAARAWPIESLSIGELLHSDGLSVLIQAIAPRTLTIGNRNQTLT